MGLGLMTLNMSSLTKMNKGEPKLVLITVHGQGCLGGALVALFKQKDLHTQDVR